jgi:hypothetical protein
LLDQTQTGNDSFTVQAGCVQPLAESAEIFQAESRHLHFGQFLLVYVLG